MDYVFWAVIIIIALAMLSAVFSGWTSVDKKADPKYEGVSPSDIFKWGVINEHLICPHCQTKGRVHTKSVIHKKGVSGAKATGAILTGGVSLLATGLSRKEGATQAHCATCKSTWNF